VVVWPTESSWFGGAGGPGTRRTRSPGPPPGAGRIHLPWKRNSPRSSAAQPDAQDSRSAVLARSGRNHCRPARERFAGLACSWTLPRRCRRSRRAGGKGPAHRVGTLKWPRPGEGGTVLHCAMLGLTRATQRRRFRLSCQRPRSDCVLCRIRPRIRRIRPVTARIPDTPGAGAAGGSGIEDTGADASA